MATTLPVVNRQPEFLGSLLDEQQQLSAVESFSRWHDDLDEETAPAQEKYYRSLLPASPPGPDQQLAFEVDLDACSGCKACVVACHTLNGLEEDESWRKVGTLVIGQVDDESPSAIQHVTTACHHCEDPGCLNGCPVKAYDKDPVSGIVRHLDDQCIGCKYCTMMCPYEVPQYSKRLGIVRKCDMCHQRLSVGEAPACVQSCPNEAIKIVVTSVGEVPSPDSVLVPSAPRSTITAPTTSYVSTRTIDPANTLPQDVNVDEVAESHWPLALMLVMTQVAVGILIADSAAWLTLLGANQLGFVELAEASLLPLAIAATAFMVANAGLGIAPLHLGQPLRAWRVFLGLRTSWLSREAVVLGKFMGVLSLGIGLLALPLVWDWIPGAIQNVIPTELIPSWAGRVLMGLSIPVGLAGLYCSSMIYIATKRKLWRSERTLPRFFATTVTSGPIVVAAIYAAFGFRTTTAALCLISIVAMLWKWKLENNVYLSESASKEDPYDQRSVRLVFGPLAAMTRTRAVLFFPAIVLAAMAAIACPFSSVTAAAFAASSSLFWIGGEYLERLLYFKSVVFDRMPGTL
ncbi:MAG: DmsC/YnfH family molybdoenzyme membrane anchor subunit [Planctomycetota bacterium]